MNLETKAFLMEYWMLFLDRHITVIFLLTLCFKMIHFINKYLQFNFVDTNETQFALFLIMRRKHANK